jgi:hypothetical protein
MPAAKKQRRRCTPVVVRPPTIVPITPEDYELTVHAIARMIAHWWDANGRKIPDTEQQRLESSEHRRPIAD